MDDVAPELLEKIREKFNERMESNGELKALEEKIHSGHASYADAQRHAVITGEALKGALGEVLSSDVLPDGHMYYNIGEKVMVPLAREVYDRVFSAAAETQKGLNEQAGLHLQVQKPEFNEDRIHGIIDRLDNTEKFDDAAWLTQEPVVNFSQSVVDDTIKENVEFHAQAGLSPKIVRIAEPKCCQWCQDLAGEYDYPADRDVYQRHENCQCVIEYYPANEKIQRQTDWRHNVWEARKERIQERIARAESQKTTKSGSTNKMAALSPNDWSETTPKAYTQVELRQITNHIYERGYKVHDIREFDGDIALLDKQLDCLDAMQREFPLQTGSKITISIKDLGNDDFAETDVKTITFNTRALRNEEVTVNNILSNSDFAGREFQDIARHEYGHAYESGRREYFGLEVAEKAYYNIYEHYPSTSELLNTIESNISVYATTGDMFGKPVEVISELFCRQKNDPNQYTNEMIKIIEEKNHDGVRH